MPLIQGLTQDDLETIAVIMEDKQHNERMRFALLAKYFERRAGGTSATEAHLAIIEDVIQYLDTSGKGDEQQ